MGGDIGKQCFGEFAVVACCCGRGVPLPQVTFELPLQNGAGREEAGEVSAALSARFGLRESQRRHKGNWAALLLLAPPG